MRITRVYTRTGDRGTTRLVGGREISKNDLRVHAYGTVDELNSVLGLARAWLEQEPRARDAVARVGTILREVQNDLFSVAAVLATLPADRWPGMPAPGDAEVTRLEALIDGLNADLPPLREFVLPGGGVAAATLHQARTVCRRAERCVVALQEDGADHDGALRYLNRLADLLFVLARWTGQALGEPEYTWSRKD